MADKAPSRAPEPLAALDAVVAQGAAENLASLLPSLKEQCPEEAVERLRRPGRPRTESTTSLVRALEPAAAKARARRTARLGMDSNRTRLRLRLMRREPLLDLDTQDLQILMAEALHLEGLRPALDLGRHPRPQVVLAPPLSAGVAGFEEVLEAELSTSPAAGWLSRLQARLPEGLEIPSAEELPSWASPALELARRADYAWPCALPRDLAESCLLRFLTADTFPYAKPGKKEGQKTEKQVDLRPEVIEASWEGGTLRFAMPLRPGSALSPLKLLAGIFALDPTDIRGLARTRIHLAEDPRLQQADRFATKLKNIYEDATLLTAGGNIVLVDEDEDEPLRLG